MAIENRKLEPGTRLVAMYKKQEHHALVLEDGKILWQRQAEDGTPITQRTYKSVSAAGSAVMGGIACNGWRFWSLANGEPPVAPKALKSRERTKKAGVLPDGATAKDYWIDADGRPIYDGETPLAVEMETE